MIAFLVLSKSCVGKRRPLVRQTLLAIEATALQRMHEFSVDSQGFKHIHCPYVSLICVKVPQHFELVVKSLRHVVGAVHAISRRRVWQISPGLSLQPQPSLLRLHMHWGYRCGVFI